MDDATRFRRRAKECRNLAKDATNEDATLLEWIASELDAEADRIEQAQGCDAPTIKMMI